MALPENYKPRKGDRLTFTGTVEYDSREGQEYVFLENVDGDEVAITLATAYKYCSIVFLGWRVGDFVANTSEEVWGQVVYVDGSNVCVKAIKSQDYVGALFVWDASELTSWTPEPEVAND